MAFLLQRKQGARATTLEFCQDTITPLTLEPGEEVEFDLVSNQGDDRRGGYSKHNSVPVQRRA
jgi:hypothetical protein